MTKLRMSCPCHFGLESVLSFEVKKIGGEDIAVSDGKVAFSGDFGTLALANICLSTAERVLIELASFRADSFEALFQGIKAIPLEEFIGKNDAFPVKGSSLNSQLHSIPDCQKIIKKAAVERLKPVYGVEYFQETGSVHQLQFMIMKDIATIYLDTSGSGLHKRGYRKNANTAPIKETLAAGIIDLARVRQDSIVCDPFCGSGTMLIESAFKALSIPPGINRKFASEQWDCIPQNVWTDARKEAISKVNRQGTFRASGFDIDAEAVALTAENCKKAGIFNRISVSKADIRDFVAPQDSTIICNPPYGERLLEIREAEELYKVMGEKFGQNSCYIISPHEDFERFFGRRADKRRKLYNGMIKCQLFMYFK